MKCPFCEKEIKKGVIHGGRYSLKWIEESRDMGSETDPMSCFVAVGLLYIENYVIL